ncbi:protein of unknown function (DUF4201) [Carpediemonas membranifera]|uniref:CCDC113/CCDC96 coiled-coil domain-containing protein n=1 Tax=Carpediemonas membranifera TaxID=201153 RepID=A0A8J6B1F8_9EUKA|nr:protein of unknown function (DUF4201) [Carpediemonas membranifera]|eukprot:KAG9390899.1 protein of unknown function (DUF4201) [Carpediemonas membranifera]
MDTNTFTETGSDVDVQDTLDMPLFEPDLSIDELREENDALVLKVRELLSTKQVEDALSHYSQERSLSDVKGRYSKSLAHLGLLALEFRRIHDESEKESERLQGILHEKQEHASKVVSSLDTFKQEVAKCSVSSRTGQPLTDRAINKLMEEAREAAAVVEKLRLANIRAQQKLKRFESGLQQKEELADRLHLIDFEQLKIENQTLNEKTEERNEELLKLHKKTTTTVQVLSHLREKLQSVLSENQELKREMQEMELAVAQRRDELSKIKQVRDRVRAENHRKRHESGLSGNQALLQDFAVRQRNVAELEMDIGRLAEKLERLNAEAGDM